jgi:hypothetical protein
MLQDRGVATDQAWKSGIAGATVCARRVWSSPSTAARSPARRRRDTRLLKLRFDDSPAALRLWNFLLTEEDRLRAARESGKKLVGAMKDLGTVPVMAYSLDNLVGLYPDGAWWIPCVMELNTGLLQIADSLGIDESFCPVRAMLGAFVTEAHFPLPDLLTCSVAPPATISRPSRSASTASAIRSSGGDPA